MGTDAHPERMALVESRLGLHDTKLAVHDEKIDSVREDVRSDREENRKVQAALRAEIGRLRTAIIAAAIGVSTSSLLLAVTIYVSRG